MLNTRQNKTRAVKEHQENTCWDPTQTHAACERLVLSRAVEQHRSEVQLAEAIDPDTIDGAG